MAAFDDVHDPIIRIFAMNLVDDLVEISFLADHHLYLARRSLLSNPRAGQNEKNDATRQYYDAYDPNVRYRIHISNRCNEAIKTISEIYQSKIRATEFFLDSRRHFVRYTNIDTNLANLRRSLTPLSEKIHLLTNVLTKSDPNARDKIYELVIGSQLEQLDAPYLFEVDNDTIDLAPPPPIEKPANASEALAILTSEASAIAKRLELTNADRRFLTALTDYIGALIETDFSPIKVDLYSSKLRAYLLQMADELPSFAIAEVSALLLSQERVLRQFPVWREFESDASQYEPDQDELTKQHDLLANIATETRQASGVASNEVLAALERLERSSGEIETRKTATLGVWRSLENFIKVNIRHVIELAKTIQNNLSRNQSRYIRYLERIIPYLKLYVGMNDNRKWLLPVVQWLDEVIKLSKQR
ncbi:hypothetical protein BJ123_12276 [Rhodopseudomonas thermotolerans]|uniref:Uncharacterized protein n=2 Tax=Rhodopseudomonas TaxID=1073 RepID=A0A336JSV8_9BRAD|nr:MULTISPECIES: hypothetical protein [Rhodopseudomonas]RED28548.1 hypothetical protein BJ125_12276 [Rhodopseudomonas pentothenatexigens]REF91467.1 hypothetical protein BJ123_12276 [Rhodopseudomonas thermotolerans]SSW92648.1 hypothetical protein SAMN05892882_12276 [Rhodopseudomonas pentothenatexigens]